MSARTPKGKTACAVYGNTTGQGVVQMVNRSAAEPTQASSMQGNVPGVTGPMGLSTS